MKHRFTTLAALVLLAACGEAPTGPEAPIDLAPAFSHLAGHQIFTSGAQVDTWNPIVLQNAMGLTAACVATPAVGLDANWTSPHKATDFGLNYAVFQTVTQNKWGWQAPWINAWGNASSSGAPGDSPSHDENWTRYSVPVQGNGTFVLRLSADNCSWIYLDGTLVASQLKDPRDVSATANPTFGQFGVTLSGAHTLEFIVFDGGGQAGGMFSLETTDNPPPPLNPDLDGDGVLNTSDNCSLTANPEQANNDADGPGDVCDPDDDNDGVVDDDDAFPFDGSETTDTDGDGVGDNADAFPADPNETADADSDGVGDNADAYDNSDTSAILSIGTCDTGVGNTHLGNGTWWSDLIASAKAAAKNHGAFVKAVANLTDGWKKAGLITGREEGAITSCAARSK